MESNTRKKGDAFSSKMLAIGGIICLLMIPLGMLQLLVSERESRRDEVRSELSSGFENEQFLFGPFLAVPYSQYLPDGRQEDSIAYIRPSNLKVQMELAPLRRNRGIFELLAYDATISFEGNFGEEDLTELIQRSSNLVPLLDPGAMRIVLGLQHPRGFKRFKSIQFQGREIDPQHSRIGDILEIPVTLEHPNGARSFSFSINAHGTGIMRIVPSGGITDVLFTSPWASPSFSGERAPSSKELTRERSVASWHLSALDTGFPGDPLQDPFGMAGTLGTATGIGVELLVPVDGYRSVERAIKYGLLQLVLTFLVFLLFENLAKLQVHWIQYGIVGGAIVLFFLILLALSEITPFSIGYSIASGVVISMVSLYSLAVLRAGKRAALIMVFLGTLYWILYTILQMEDLALLSGSAVLTLTLGGLMYLTRDLNQEV